MRKERRFNVIGIIFNILLKSYNFRGFKWWDFLWNFISRFNRDVFTTIHGYPALMNSGYSYPLYSRLFKEYNNPLLELAYLVYNEKQRKLSIIDVGAAIGDTIFLLQRNLEESIGPSICIDGDFEFFRFLEYNLDAFDQIKCFNALLSSEVNGHLNEPVRIHAGTSSAQGNKKLPSTSLDSLFEKNPLTVVDIIKIDVDGCDGLVLKGAKNILCKFKPYVIFEWHPILYNKIGSNVIDPFETLVDEGYCKFLFFTKYGNFSHFMSNISRIDLFDLERLAMRNRFDWDWHYDVVALHGTHELDEVILAECSFARNKKSPY